MRAFRAPARIGAPRSLASQRRLARDDNLFCDFALGRSKLSHYPNGELDALQCEEMTSSARAPARRRSKLSIAFTSAVRVLFTTLLFTAGGMGTGLFLGIVGTVLYGMMSGSKIDMTNAYKHVAIPVAILAGAVALIGSAVLEVRSRRQRTSL